MTPKQQEIATLHRQGLTAYKISKKMGYTQTPGYIKRMVNKLNTDNSNNINLKNDRELFICDIHLPNHDQRAVDLMLEYAKSQNITKVVLGSDLIDFESVSGFLRNPNERDTQSEREKTINFLTNLRKTFPDAQIFYIQGNHEQRFEHYIQRNAPELWNIEELSLPNLFSLDKNDIVYINNRHFMESYGHPFKIGKLYHLHGHEMRSGWNPINVSRLLFLKAQANIIFGHFHVSQEWIQRTISGKVLGSYAVGCLAKLVMPYSEINNWNHGFAIIDYLEDGSFSVHNKKIVNGSID